MRNLVAILLISLLSISISGCEKQQGEGSAERAGKKIDQTVSKAEVKAQETANTVKDTAKTATDATAKAMEKTGEKIDQAIGKAEVKTQEAANAVKDAARAAADTTGKSIERTGEVIQKKGEAMQQKPAQ